MSYLSELKKRNFVPYNYREQTLVWKDLETGDYNYYVSVILETEKSNFAWDRFDYPAFNYGILSDDIHKQVIIYRCKMVPKKKYITKTRFVIDNLVWNPVYDTIKTKQMFAF